MKNTVEADAAGGRSKPVLKKENCPQNHVCPAVKRCPEGALTQSGFAAPQLDGVKCIACGKCARVCPMGVFTFA